MENCMECFISFPLKQKHLYFIAFSFFNMQKDVNKRLGKERLKGIDPFLVQFQKFSSMKYVVVM